MNTSRSRFKRRLLSFAVGVVSVFAFVELGSLAILSWLDLRPPTTYAEMYRTSRCLKSNPFNPGAYRRRDGDLDVMLAKVPHPFFGIVHNVARDPSEGLGADLGPTYENELRYRLMLRREVRAPGDFNVGILGASVAAAFADFVIADGAFAERLRAGIPELAGKTITIRNLAIGSSRQPTQFAIATYYSELLDMVINLDGYSEIVVENYPEHPIEFPMFSDVFYPVDANLRYPLIRLAEEVCDRSSAAPLAVPLLQQSSAYYLFWYNLSIRLGQLYRQPAPGTGAANDRPGALTAADLRRLHGRYFEKYLRAQYDVLNAQGIPSYYFLQPNQYVESSKRFSGEELERALGHGQRDEIRLRYEVLRRTVASLRARGYPAFDLTMAFSEITDTVYIDSCCHVNDLGNRILAERIAEAIIAEHAHPGATARLRRDGGRGGAFLRHDEAGRTEWVAAEETTPLHAAAGRGDRAEVITRIAAGDDVDAADVFGRRALHYAVEADIDVGRLLLDADAAVDAADIDGVTPLIQAVFADTEAWIDGLARAGADLERRDQAGRTAAYWAALLGRHEILRQLVAHGAEVNLADASGKWLLFRLIEDDDRQGIRDLLEHGADLAVYDERGESPLTIAVARGDAELIDWFLQYGADPCTADPGGIPALFRAQDVELLDALVRRGADLRVRGGPGGHGLIHFAAMNGDVDVIRYLLDHGIDVDAASEQLAETPLHLAAHAGKLEALRVLLESGADPRRGTHAGATAIDYARAGGKSEAIALLEGAAR